MDSLSQIALDNEEIDRQQWEILNKIYNPNTKAFLKSQGLRPGLQVLYVGCRNGMLACEFAATVGPTGHVIGIAHNLDYLKVAKKTAQDKGLKNIEFIYLDLADLPKLNLQMDIVYERWALIYQPNPREILEAMYGAVKPGGILICEDFNTGDAGCFSYPRVEVSSLFNIYLANIFQKQGYDTHCASSFYGRFKQLHCQSIRVKLHQPPLITPEQRSILRLCYFTNKKTGLVLDSVTTTAIDNFLQQAEAFEYRDEIFGFVRNLLISGIKPPVHDEIRCL